MNNLIVSALVSLVCVVVFYQIPLSSTITRFLFVFFVLLFIGLVLWIGFVKYRNVTSVIGISIVIVWILYFLFPQNPTSQDIRFAYVQNLNSYKNVKYYWWWENYNGIDCSWLVRKWLINTYLKAGFANRNIFWVLEWIEFWRNDISAKTMLLDDKYSLVVDMGESINSFDHAILQPWDFAVTINWVHVLVYLWNNQWIQASPNASKVIINSIPDNNDPWLEQNVVFKRWKIMWNE